MIPSLTESWIMMKEIVEGALSEPLICESIGKDRKDKLCALIDLIDDSLGTKKEKVCCYPGKECKCCDRGECKTCCYCT